MWLVTKRACICHKFNLCVKYIKSVFCDLAMLMGLRCRVHRVSKKNFCERLKCYEILELEVFIRQLFKSRLLTCF